jgi:hypothetical protein
MFGLPKCFFMHNWTKWVRKVKRYNRMQGGAWLKGPDNKLIVFQDTHLERECQDCGVVEKRNLTDGEPG